VGYYGLSTGKLLPTSSSGSSSLTSPLTRIFISTGTIISNIAKLFLNNDHFPESVFADFILPNGSPKAATAKCAPSTFAMRTAFYLPKHELVRIKKKTDVRCIIGNTTLSFIPNINSNYRGICYCCLQAYKL
jgi:hypothetical protein